MWERQRLEHLNESIWRANAAIAELVRKRNLMQARAHELAAALGEPVDCLEGLEDRVAS